MKKFVYLSGILLTLVACNERNLEEDFITKNETNLKRKNAKDSTEVVHQNNQFKLDGQDPAIIVPPRR